MEFIKPRRIAPGATIGIVSPSSPISEETLEAGLKPIRERGYNVVLAEHVYDRKGYLAGEDKDRAADLHKMFLRKDIDAVMCSRGGFGAARLMPYLDASVFRENPKIFAGYSDVTVTCLWLLRHVGLVAFYSPMPITFSREVPLNVIDQMWRAFEVSEPLEPLPGFPSEMRTLVGGKAQGRVTGGCLCLINYGIGTAFEIDAKGSLIVIEDVDEAPYRIDGMLTQLQQAGKFAQCEGVAVGAASKWEDHIDKEKPQDTLTPDDLWPDKIARSGKPLITGFPFGHVHGPLTLPFGVMAELDADQQTLTYLESATV